MIWNYAPFPATHHAGLVWHLASSWYTAWRAGLWGSEWTSPPPSQNMGQVNGRSEWTSPPPSQKMSFDEPEKYLGKQAGVIME